MDTVSGDIHCSANSLCLCYVFFQCWASVTDGGAALKQHLVKVSSSLCVNHPNKYIHWTNGPLSVMLAQHQKNIGKMYVFAVKRLHNMSSICYDSTYTWCVKRDAWSVMRIARFHMYVKIWCIEVLFAEEATRCGSPCFLHTGTWHFINLNIINVSTSIASAILSQMLPIRMLSLYDVHEVSYGTGWSSTRLTNFSRHVSRGVAYNVIVTKKLHK